MSLGERRLYQAKVVQIDDVSTSMFQKAADTRTDETSNRDKAEQEKKRKLYERLFADLP